MNIIQYIQGARTGKEANQTEYESMKDPFLADALDGYNQTMGNHKKQIDKLQNSVLQKCKKKSNYGLIGGITAAVAVILGVAVYFLVIEPDAVKNLFASDSPKNQPKENIQKQIEPVIEKAKEDITVEPEVNTKPEEKAVATPTTIAPVTVTPVTVTAPPTPGTSRAEVSEKKETTPVRVVAETPATPVAVLENKEKVDKPKIKGRVTDKNGNPLADASISVPGANIRTTTNANGNFELEAENNSNILVRSLGYDPVILTGSTSQSMQVIMEEVPNQ